MIMSDSFFDGLLHETKEQDYFGHFSPGATIDRYKIISSLGVGGMGIVFKAKDIQTQQHVAIKVVLQNRLTSLSKKRFLQEVEVSGQLDHRNIIKVIKAGAFNEHIFLVMEYVAGLSLDEYCEKKNLTTENKLHLFAQICAAMEHAHSRKVIHRDLKPENIMVTADGQVKVMDFGLAKLIEGKKFQLTKSQEIMGSPRYMSPEQAKGDRHVDARTDVYALGTILYEMLTGQRMMPGDTLMEILYNIQRQNYPKHLVIAGENTPQDIELMWKKCVGKKNSRYKNAGEVSDALQQYLQQGNSSFVQRAIQRYNLSIRELLVLSIIAVVVAIYVVFSRIPQQKETIRLSKNLDTLQNLVERKLFDDAYELTTILRNNPKIDQKKLQLLTLQVQNAKGLHYEVYNSVKTMEQITPLIALEQIDALVHMHKYELCHKYFKYLIDEEGKLKVHSKYGDKVWSHLLIVYFFQGKYRKVLETYKKITVVEENLNVFLGCSYLEIYNLIVASEKKIYALQQSSALPLRESPKRDLLAQIDKQREIYKQLLAIGVQNVTEEKSSSRGTKTVVLTNAHNILKSIKERQRNVLFYEGFAKTNIFLHEETNVRTYLASAQRYLEKATKIRPQHYDYLILLGQVYSKRKLYQKAYFAFEKAIAISNNDVKAIDAFMQLPLEDARYQEQIFWSIFKSFGINFKTPKPDLLYEDIENIQFQNVHHYEAWRSNRNNHSDITQICEAFLGSTDYAQELAMEMLVLKSYSYPLYKVEDYIANVMQCLQQISPQKNSKDTKVRLYEKVYMARKKAVYYHLADFYLHHSELPTTQDFQKDVQKLLLDAKEHILIRYLAAKMLVQKSDSLLIKHYNNRQDIELALVSSCVLVEEGLFVDLDIFLSPNIKIKLDTPEKTVLYTRLFRIDKKYYELFLKRYLPNYDRRELWRNLKTKIRKSNALSKDIVAVAAILWWQAPVMNPYNKAGEILQQAMKGNDKTLAAYAHHFYWISPHVYTLAQKYRQQYYDYLENADSSCQLQMLNSNRFYSKMDDIHFFNVLEKLAIEGSSTVRLKATYILADRQPYSKQFIRIVNHTSLSNAQRTLAYVSGVVGKLQVLIKNKKKYDIKVLQSEILQVCALYDQLMLNRDNDAFKSFIYKVTAFLGLRSLIQLSKSNYSPQLTANIIMNLCSDPMLPASMLPFLTRFLGVTPDDNKTLRKILSDYEFSPSTNVLRSVASAYAFLGDEAPRHDKQVWKSGFAWGKYRKLRQKLMLKETGFYERVHAASSSYYDLYLQKLTTNKLGKDKKPHQLQNYIRQLQVALEFAQEDVFRAKFNYELSILYHTMSNLVADNSKAQKFLDLAEKHIQKSLEQVDLPLEYKMRYELQLAYIKSETSISTAHITIEKYLPLTKNPTLLDVMLATLEGHSDEKTQYLYREVLHKKLLCVAKFHFINDDDSKKSYSQIKKTHLLLQKVSRYSDFHQTCHKIIQTYLKLEKY